MTVLASSDLNISVVVPTRDRPEFLLESLQSIARQSSPAHEVIVVDDASSPPVDEKNLKAQCTFPVRVIRINHSKGLAWARYLGVQAVSASLVAHLDDDDLYHSDFLRHCLNEFSREPQLELLFVNAKGIGEHAALFDDNQQRSLSIFNTISEQQSDAITMNSQELFELLLRRVPMAFQRVVTRPSIWLRVSGYRMSAYSSVHQVSDAEVFDLLGGTLRDSEWSLYAALLCRQVALLSRPLYLQRCDQQGYSSRDTMRIEHAEQLVRIKLTMLKAAKSLAELAQSEAAIRESLASAYFDLAYQYSQKREKGRALGILFKSCALSPSSRQVQLAAQLCLSYLQRNNH